MPLKAVFLDKKTFADNVSLEQIKQQVSTLHCYDTTAPEDIVSRCIDADIIITNKVVLDQEILTKMPQLKLVCIAATGINNVDILSAQQLGIAVTNVSGYAKNAVAQYVFAQILAYFSQIEHHNNNVNKGLWQQSPTFCLHGNGSRELAEKTLGIIGYGSLGHSVAHLAKAFNMRVIVAERPSATMIRPERMAFDDVIKQADILSLHCPLTKETENLINLSVFKSMKASAMLINTARGGIVNEDDLLTALTTNEIAFAVLDVLAQEPPQPTNPLLNNQPSNLKITAHIAWASIEAQQRLLDLIAINIADFKLGKNTNRVDG